MTQTADPAADRAYAEAAHLLRSGRLEDVDRRLAPLLEAGSTDARLYAVAGFARLRRMDAAGAALVLARAVSLDPNEATYAVAYGDALTGDNRPQEAEAAFRLALSLDPRRTIALMGLSESLLRQGRMDAAVQVFADAAAGRQDHEFLAAWVNVLRLARRHEEVLEVQRRAVALYPGSGVAHHNLAASLGDGHDYAPAAESARRAMELGQTGPATWLVLARALEGLGRTDAAIDAYREVLRQAPTDAEAGRELAQIIWMRTGDVTAAGKHLTDRLASHPNEPTLVGNLAKLREMAGDRDGAFDLLTTAIAHADSRTPSVLVQAADLALTLGRADEALSYAREAERLRPGEHRVLVSLIDAMLATGDAEGAQDICETLLARDPDDQMVLARAATAWRLLRDPRCYDLYDYDKYVHAYRISPPEGWTSLSDYLADLSAALLRLHGHVQHPFDQSLRGGSQTTLNLTATDEPAVKAFFSAIDAPIREHMQRIATDTQGMGRHATGDYSVVGAWSVFLRPNGFHVDHIHPMGWISSAFYIDVPPEEPDDPHAGWIKFGEPGVKTWPELGAEHHVKPEPGLLVMFPSYMWHGTVPFRTGERRLTMAFDLHPTPVR
jgi:tetratricopeptide (TPR) repeat protein